jgi:hypothetical protein
MSASTLGHVAGAPAAHCTPSTAGSSAAKEGLKLAEQLHAVAQQLRTPAVARAATPTPSPAGAIGESADVDADHTFQFKDDVAALLQALDARTPTSLPRPAAAPSARTAADASTEERPGPRRRRSTSLQPSAAPLLDLSAFDPDGNRNTPEPGTPTVPAPHVDASPAAAPRAGALPAAPAADSAALAALAGEVAELRSRCERLGSEREEAAALLSGYQGSIAELQDRHSTTVVRMQAEAALLKSEVSKDTHMGMPGFIAALMHVRRFLIIPLSVLLPLTLPEFLSRRLSACAPSARSSTPSSGRCTGTSTSP